MLYVDRIYNFEICKRVSTFFNRITISFDVYYSFYYCDYGRYFESISSNQGQYYYIDYGPYLESLEHVVGHYMNHADGLPAELQRPIKPPSPVTDDKIVFRMVISFLETDLLLRINFFNFFVLICILFVITVY